MNRIDDDYTILVPGGEGDGIGYAAIIERPTVYYRPGGHEILGVGWAWHANLKHGMAVHGPMSMSGPAWEYSRQLVNAPHILVVSI